jgi:hypothetical protein
MHMQLRLSKSVASSLRQVALDTLTRRNAPKVFTVASDGACALTTACVQPCVDVSEHLSTCTWCIKKTARSDAWERFSTALGSHATHLRRVIRFVARTAWECPRGDAISQAHAGAADDFNLIKEAHFTEEKRKRSLNEKWAHVEPRFEPVKLPHCTSAAKHPPASLWRACRHRSCHSRR